MLRVAAKITNCNDAYTCPQVIEVDGMADDVLVQGREDAPALADAAPPAGERQVRVPRSLLIKAGKQLAHQALFDAFTHEAFRLETRDQYLVPAEAERFRAFREGRPLPERSPQSSPWLAQIARRAALGRCQVRVHVVSWPPSEYVRFELATDAENVAAGEQVRVIDRAIWRPHVADLTGDFWLFDATTDHATALLLRYDDDGRFVDAEVSTDREVITRCCLRRRVALARSLPLADYLDRVGRWLARAG